MIRSVVPNLTQLQSTFLKQCVISSSSSSVKAACDVPHVSLPGPQYQQVRTTFILKRPKPLPLSKSHLRIRAMKPRERIYEFVDYVDNRKSLPLKVILTSSVEGLGTKGDVIEAMPHKARNHLILPGLAVYASPENMEKYSYLMKEDSKADEASSPFALKTASELSARSICVSMNMHNPWKIEPWHIRVAFRKAGIIVPEESLTLPSKPIEGPDFSLQGKEFLVKVKINKKEESLVRCRVHHFSTNVTEAIPAKPDHYLYHAEPIFPEEGPILEELARRNPTTRFGEEEVL